MSIPHSNQGPTCAVCNPVDIKDGTLTLLPGNPPGPTGRTGPTGRKWRREVLLAWNSPGHQMMVSGSIRDVASDVPGWLFGPLLDFDHSGNPRPGADALESLEYLTKAEDFTFANAAGECTITVAGGQVVHFMRDPFQPERIAYGLSLEHILSNGADAAEILQGRIRFHYDHSIIGSVLNTPDFYAPVRRHLAAALHTLQDSFSPGHVKRDEALVIQAIFVWDEQNKTHHESDDASWTSPPNPNRWSPRDTDAAGIERSPLGKAAVAAGAELLRCVYRAAKPGIGNGRARFRQDALRTWVPRYFSHILPPGLRQDESKALQEREDKWRQEQQRRIEHNLDKW
jgi:hypothetical protein